ncbi:hypothetical protein L838_4940 [Mycobacterium avium MAV_120709_2344]|nr:hypothetical protein L838_4940 [Mycobacterium avium MAV_120709_2344]
MFETLRRAYDKNRRPGNTGTNVAQVIPRTERPERPGRPERRQRPGC